MDSRNGLTVAPSVRPVWGEIVPGAEWALYQRAIQAIRATDAGFLLGGAFGLAAYTGRWRNTKDIDFYVHPRDREPVVQALTAAGFIDYYQTLPYDRGWIYRSTRDEVIVDIIWGTPNRRGEVDDLWLAKAPTIQIRNETLKVVPAEDLLSIKLYIVQKDRCDWPDLFNLLYATAHFLDWTHVLKRLDDDVPLLAGLLNVFTWLCPDQAAHIPSWVRSQFHLPDPSNQEPKANFTAIRLLDSRPWFAASQPADVPMQL